MHDVFSQHLYPPCTPPCTVVSVRSRNQHVRSWSFSSKSWISRHRKSGPYCSDPELLAAHLAHLSNRSQGPDCVGEFPAHPANYPGELSSAHWATLQRYCISSPGASCSCMDVPVGQIPTCFGAEGTEIPQWVWSSARATMVCRQHCRCLDGPEMAPPDIPTEKGGRFTYCVIRVDESIKSRDIFWALLVRLEEVSVIRVPVHISPWLCNKVMLQTDHSPIDLKTVYVVPECGARERERDIGHIIAPPIQVMSAALVLPHWPQPCILGEGCTGGRPKSVKSGLNAAYVMKFKQLLFAVIILPSRIASSPREFFQHTLDRICC